MATGDSAFNLCTFTDEPRTCTPLASAACCNDDIRVHKLLIKSFTGALDVLAAPDDVDDDPDDDGPLYPHELAAATERPAAVVSLLEDAWDALRDDDFPALGTLLELSATYMQEQERTRRRGDRRRLVVCDDWQGAEAHHQTLRHRRSRSDLIRI